MHCRTRDRQVVRDAGGSPAFGVERHDGMPSHRRLSDLGVAWIAAAGDRRAWTGGQHLLDRVGTGLAIEAHRADTRNLMQTQVRILGFKIHDGLTDGWREQAVGVLTLFECGAKETEHPLAVEGVGHAAQGALRMDGLLGAFGWRVAKEDHRPYKFICSLGRPEAQLADDRPVLSMRMTCTCRHTAAP